MKTPYLDKRKRQQRLSCVTGLALTAAVHLSGAIYGTFTGYKYIYPPPEEESILLDFSEDESIEPMKPRVGKQPRAVNADPENEIKLVKASEAQNVGTKANEAQEATVGPDGDVEVPEPPRKREIDKRALFHAADNKSEKDTLAPQVAPTVSDKLSAGHPEGNSKTKNISGEPQARVKGRNVDGTTLFKPEYTESGTGRIVVEIWVDRYGKVVSAYPGVEGSTITNKTLLNEARIAALKARFNPDVNAPEKVKGTITYIFTEK